MCNTIGTACTAQYKFMANGKEVDSKFCNLEPHTTQALRLSCSVISKSKVILFRTFYWIFIIIVLLNMTDLLAMYTTTSTPQNASEWSISVAENMETLKSIKAASCTWEILQDAFKKIQFWTNEVVLVGKFLMFI